VIIQIHRIEFALSMISHAAH